jgi:Holliday junction resolvasome RuvABC endonuclease subunit
LESGVWDFSRSRGIRHYGYLYQALYCKLDLYAKPETLLAFELAHHRAGPATRIGVGLNATVLHFAVRRDLPDPLSVHTATLKKWVTGSGRAEKWQIINWARGQLGRDPIDDNEADAVAVGLWADTFMREGGSDARMS